MSPQACSLSNDNLLLAGTVLKNTGHVFACCVYAGTQTKISLNSKITKNKFSTLERSLNKYLIVMVVILMLEMTTSTILSFTFDHEFRKVRQLQPPTPPPHKIKFCPLHILSSFHIYPHFILIMNAGDRHLPLQSESDVSLLWS